MANKLLGGAEALCIPFTSGSQVRKGLGLLQETQPAEPSSVCLCAIGTYAKELCLVAQELVDSVVQSLYTGAGVSSQGLKNIHRALLPQQPSHIISPSPEYL